MRRRPCFPCVKGAHVSTIINQSQVAVMRARQQLMRVPVMGAYTVPFRSSLPGPVGFPACAILTR